MTAPADLIAIIPARGGSKGIPRKNVRPLCGKPLLAYAIENGRSSAYVGRVAVSTDDPEIGTVAASFGAEVIERPSAISGDDDASELALLHALERIEEREGRLPEIFAFLQCTSPLIEPADVDGTVRCLLENEADVAFAVTPSAQFLWVPGAGGTAAAVNHDPAFRPMRQRMEPQFRETGAVYVLRTAGFLRHRHRFFGRVAMHAIPEERSLDIDTPMDFAVAELFLRERRRRERFRPLPREIDAVVLDFDGVLTDNRVLVFADGTEAVTCDRSDGLWLSGLRPQGLPVFVLSSERNGVVAARCGKLGVDCISGAERKLPLLEKLLRERGFRRENVVYLGNDVNDLECMAHVGCAVAVRDAQKEVRDAAKIVLESRGGHGAARELMEAISAERR